MGLVGERLPDCETTGAPVFEALTFEQSIPPIYQEVYPEPMKVRPKLKEQLNDFLRDWLRNLISQGHRLVPPETAETAET